MNLPGDLAALRAGGKAALARTLTALETEAGAEGLAALLDAALAAPRGLALGLTGPPGVGKSTLTNALIRRMRAGGETVGVIAVDPSSARSGGALLGDRTRIESDPEDPGRFLRSMAARDRLGGLAEITYPAIVLLRALYDRVIVETVGVGQSETEVAGAADLVLFCAQPGSGDSLQFMKAGVMEVPDIIVVTKADMGVLAERAAADISGALGLAAGGEAPPVLTVSAETGAGLDALMAEIAARGAALGPAELAARRRAQTRAWCDARLRARFGARGATAVAGRIVDELRPFTGSEAILRDLDTAFQQMFPNT